MDRFVRDDRVAVVAEMAQSYEGSIEIAVEIATKACRAGVDAVMFQVVYADELAVPTNRNYDLFRSLELPAESWQRIVTNVHQAGGLAFGEVFGKRSADISVAAGINGFKIHAADLSNMALLRHVAKTNLPILLSVGGSLEEEVRTAVEVLEESGSCEIILMHGYQLCPTPLEDSHILKIRALGNAFGLPVGYADHIAGSLEGNIGEMNRLALIVPLLAMAAGARVIEKHVMLDRSHAWEDHESALTPDEFVGFVSQIRDFETALGVDDLSSNAAEGAYRRIAKKYVVAACDIAAGTTLDEKLIAFKRIANTDEGIVSAREVIGKVLIQSIAYNEVIKKDILING